MSETVIGAAIGLGCGLLWSASTAILRRRRSARIRADVAVATVTHACPPPGSGIMPCCARTPFEVSDRERLTANYVQVTCKGRPGFGL